MKFDFDLQKFAYGGGGVVNATGHYTNAYTGVESNFDNPGPNTLSPEMKTYYDKELLENARAEMVHAQFARKQSIPKGRGKTIEWRKFNTLPNADKLTEGVIPDGKKLGVSSMTDTVEQYGLYVSVSDQLELTAIDPVILEAQTELSASAGKTRDELVRNDIIGGTSVIYAKRVSGGTYYDVTSRSGLDATAKLTADTVARAATFLKKNNAPTVKGCFVAFVHPSVAYDLRKDPAWLDAHKYAAPEEIFDGEIGKLHNVRFIESTQAKVWKAAPLASDTRTLAVNGAVTANAGKTITFDGSTAGVDTNELKDRYIWVNNVRYKVASNTSTVITVDSASNLPAISDNTVIYPGEGPNNDLAVYLVLFVGNEAYGTVDVTGGGLEMIMHDKSEGGGPLNQFSTIGYKLLTNGAKILYEDRMVRVECCGAYSDIDDAN